MSHAIEFIETSLFTRQIRLIATDDGLKTSQCELIESPDKGYLIQGKSRSARVIYFLATS